VADGRDREVRFRFDAPGAIHEGHDMRKMRIAASSLGLVAVASCGESPPQLPDAGIDALVLPITVEVLAGEVRGFGRDDGAGAAARFYRPYGVAIDGAGDLFVADGNNASIRKVTAAGAVTTVAASGQAGVSFTFPYGVAVDAAGNIYVADGDHTIRKITPAGTVTTLAGTAGVPGTRDGIGTTASFFGPTGVAVDGAGNVYVADANNHTIRKITPAGVVATFAGTPRSPGAADGTGTDARFHLPQGVAADSAGNVYVADTQSSTIRKITSAGVVTTLAGTAHEAGSADGTGAGARFSGPTGVALDGAGNVYVADQNNQSIRKVTPAGVVTTLAGTAPKEGSADGTGRAARFFRPTGVAADAAGNVFVADQYNNVIRKVSGAGVVTTLAGLAANGSADGIGRAARLFFPTGVAVDGAGNVFVADTENLTVRKVAAGGAVTTLAGAAGIEGSADGTGPGASFTRPMGAAVDRAGNVYVTEWTSEIVRKITPDGVVTTLAGTAGVSGGNDGTGAAARFWFPSGATVDRDNNLYVVDAGNNTVRKITAGGVVTTLAGTAGAVGGADGTGPAAQFSSPVDVAVDGAGNLYVADSLNYIIRKVTPDGVVTTLAGKAYATGNVDGVGPAARFDFPYGVAVDAAGNVFVADQRNYSIRKITPTGVTTTVALLRELLGTLPGELPPAPSRLAIVGDSILVTVSSRLDCNAILLLRHAAQ
jgi:sugar lactone lactonase YvrE